MEKEGIIIVIITISVILSLLWAIFNAMSVLKV